MSKLKPIGSEKLQGSQKLNRMLEIAMYKEVQKEPLNENFTNEYNIVLPDGKQYSIVKEKTGYIIKRGLSESTLDYIEPMRNRTYYRSYAQAFKKLNLITKELNDLYDNPNGVSLFGEQTKYTLKTPKPPTPPPPPVDEVPAAPPAVPEPELPPSPIGNDAPSMDGMAEPTDDMGGMDMGEPTDDMGGMDMGEPTADMNVPEPSMGNAVEKITFRTIQRITGKLTQKIRTLENDKGLTSEEIKYVINMVLSSLTLDVLDENDRDDIISKIDGSENDGMSEPMDDMGMEEPTDDMGGMGMEEPMDNMGMEEPMPEMKEEENYYGNEGYDYERNFNESKIDRIISNYFDDSHKNKPVIKNNKILEENFKKIKNISKTMLQLETTKLFVKNNKGFNVLGITNLDNIVLENKDKQVRIDKKGNII
jgi:hypothetical protein